MPTIDVILNRLASRVDPRTKSAQQTFNDATAAIAVTATANQGGLVKITTASAHGMRTGCECYIVGVTGTTEANNSLANLCWVVTVLTATTFTIPVTYAHAWASAGTVTPARIGSSRGNVFEPQQLLNIWNQARFAAFGALRAKYGNDKRTLQREVGALLTSVTVTFTGATPASGTKPIGYCDFVSLSDGSGTIHLVGADRIQAILENRPNYVQSSTNRQVFEVGTVFQHSATFVTGNTTLRYLGITDFTLTNVLSGTSSESFNESYLNTILELSEAIAQEMGGNDLGALAKKLLGA